MPLSMSKSFGPFFPPKKKLPGICSCGAIRDSDEKHTAIVKTNHVGRSQKKSLAQMAHVEKSIGCFLKAVTLG